MVHELMGAVDDRSTPEVPERRRRPVFRLQAGEADWRCDRAADLFHPSRRVSKAVVLQSHPYDKEEILQSLLADHPDVLAGGTTEGDGTGKLLLVRREIGHTNG